MTIKMEMNRADLNKLMSEVLYQGCDSFTVIRHSETSIGYLMDIEFVDKVTKELHRVPIVTYSDW